MSSDESGALSTAVAALRRARERGEYVAEGGDHLHAVRLLNDGIEAFLRVWDGRRDLTGDLGADVLAVFGRLDAALTAPDAPAYGDGLARRLAAVASARQHAKPPHRWRDRRAGESLPGQPTFIGDQVCDRCGLWVDCTGVAPAFYNADGRSVDGDEEACDGPSDERGR